MDPLLEEAKRLTDLLEATSAELLARRNEALRAAHAAGFSLREIARATGLSHMTVQRACE